MDSKVFLQTKLHPSQVATRNLTRSRLLGELRTDQRHRVILVTGPAGSGKSTLLADTLAQGGARAAWLSLGEEDRDPQVFVTYFLEALSRVYPQALEQTRQRLCNSADLESLAPHLINELHEYAQPVAIVLDDYHLVDQQPAINSFMTLLSRSGPANLTLLIASRDLPNLPLAWLRAKRLMVEIHPYNLRFTAEETAALFRDIWNQRLEDDLVNLLVEKTEGWATALQLVAQALGHRSELEARRYILELGGSESNIFDYLASEVFHSQPPAVREFLKLTAVPESFNVELAEQLVNGCSAREMLQYLKNSRLFLVQLDRDGDWYRYHHLFRDFLRRKLSLDEGPAVEAAVHRATAEWLYQNEEIVASVPHFLACEDAQLAGQILEQVGGELLQKGLCNSVTRWLEALPSSLRYSRPGLLVLQSEIYDLKGHWPRAVEGYRAALEEYRRWGRACDVASVLEKLSLCYLKYGQSQYLLETCEEGLKLCSDDSLAQRALLQTWLGGCLINSGEDWHRGYELLQSSHALAYQSGDARAISWACTTYGFAFHFPQGNFDEAFRTLNEGIEFFTRLGWPMVLYQLSMNKALVQIICGDPGSAAVLIEETLEAARRAGHTYVEKGLENLRGMAYLESGQWTNCRTTLDKIAQGEIPSQFKPWFFRNRMMLNCLEQNLGQAHVDAEEMDRCLLLSGAGIYAPECNVAAAFLCIQSGQLKEAQTRLRSNLALCGRARAKFWEMKTQALLALAALMQNRVEEFRLSMGSALALTRANDYQGFWLNDAWNIAIPLLVGAIARDVETTTAEKLVARYSRDKSDTLEELVRHSDANVRGVSIRLLGYSGKGSVRLLLKEVHRSDPDPAVRELAKKSLKIPEQGNRLEMSCL